MIKEELIKKLGLRDEGVHNGTSFINDCKILVWPIRKQFKVYVMDCDLDGEPLERDMLKIFWTHKGEHGIIDITPESLSEDILIELYNGLIPPDTTPH